MKCKRLWAMALLCPFLFETGRKRRRRHYGWRTVPPYPSPPWEAASRPAPLDEAFLPANAFPKGMEPSPPKPSPLRGPRLQRPKPSPPNRPW